MVLVPYKQLHIKSYSLPPKNIYSTSLNMLDSLLNFESSISTNHFSIQEKQALILYLKKITFKIYWQQLHI